jgi:hypothetical protein
LSSSLLELEEGEAVEAPNRYTTRNQHTAARVEQGLRLGLAAVDPKGAMASQTLDQIKTNRLMYFGYDAHHDLLLT